MSYAELLTTKDKKMILLELIVSDVEFAEKMLTDVGYL